MTMTFYDYVSLVETVEKKDETATGKSVDGMTVDCRPVVDDPQIVERKSRVACLTKPHAACYYCSHSSFDLLFNTNKDRRVEQVSCPRWEPGGRIGGKPPEDYVSVEMATCADMPFEFCPSCPSRKNVEVTGANKSVPGWYSRWNRVSQRTEDEDE